MGSAIRATSLASRQRTINSWPSCRLSTFLLHRLLRSFFFLSSLFFLSLSFVLVALPTTKLEEILQFLPHAPQPLADLLFLQFEHFADFAVREDAFLFHPQQRPIFNVMAHLVDGPLHVLLLFHCRNARSVALQHVPALPS